MADWRALKEQAVAKQAMDYANSSSPSPQEQDVFGSAFSGLTPQPKPVAEVGTGALPGETSMDVTNRLGASNFAAQEQRQQATLDSPFWASLEGAKSGIPKALEVGGDAFMPVASPLMYPIDRAITSFAPGDNEDQYGPEKRLAGTWAKPFANTIPSMDFKKTLGDSTPSLQHEAMNRVGLLASGAMEPSMTPSQRALMGVGAAAQFLPVAAGIKGPVTPKLGPLPAIGNPIFGPASKAASFVEGLGIENPTVGRFALDLLGIARSTPPGESLFDAAVRRGGINMPGKPQMTKEESDRLARLAYQASQGDVEGTNIAWVAGAERARDVANMDDKAVMALMRDAIKGDALKENRRGISLDKAEQVAAPSVARETEEGLGLSPEATKEILGEPTPTPAESTSSSRTYAFRDEPAEDAAARLSRVEKGIAEGGDIDAIMKDAERLPREDVWDLTRSLGVYESRNKTKELVNLRKALESNSLESRQSVTTPEGRREEKEIQAAVDAKQMAEAPTAPVPAPTPINKEQVFQDVLDLRLEGKNDLADKALKDAGIPIKEYSDWRKGREVPKPSTPLVENGATPRTPETPPPPPTPTVPPQSSGPVPPKAESAPSHSAPQPRPGRNQTGFAANHIDLLENASIKANNAAGRELAEKGREIVNYGESNAARPVREINQSYESLSKNRRALQETGDLVAPKAWADAGAPDLRVGRFQANVDANAPKMGIQPEEVAFSTKEANDYANAYVKGMAETGKEAENLGVVTSSGEPFVSKNGQRFIQQLDPSAYGWMKEGDPLFNKLKDQLAKIYPDADLSAIGQSLKSMASQPLDRQAAFEFERVIPMMPAAIVDDAGKLRPILKYYPVPTAVHTSNPVARILESQWMRLGGIKHLGQDVTTALADTTDAATGLLSETPLGQALQAGGEKVVQAANGMLGAIYHRPEAGYTGVSSSTWSINKSLDRFSQAFRAVTGRVVPTLNLSRQGIVSSYQTLGEVPAMTGALNFAKAMAKVAVKYGESSEEARVAGAISEKFLMAGSEVYDRHRLLESILDANANRFPTERLNDFVKDLNDTIAFTAGDYKAEELLRKGLKQSDLLMMDEMNLPQSVQDVFRNPSAFDEAAVAGAKESFARSVVKETQFHSKNNALKGRFENDSALRWVLPYQSYSINTLKRTAKDFERVWSTAKAGFAEHALNLAGIKYEPFRNALNRLSMRVLGMQAAGESVADISSAGQGKDPLRRDRSALARFLENMSYVGFLGPLHFVADMASSHFLEGDEAKRFADARAGSRAPDLSNPVFDAVAGTTKEVLKGNVGNAAYKATVGQAPLFTNVGRATGLMEPTGDRKGRGLFEKASSSRGLFEKVPTSRGLFEKSGGSSNRGLFDKPGQRRGLFEKQR